MSDSSYTLHEHIVLEFPIDFAEHIPSWRMEVESYDCFHRFTIYSGSYLVASGSLRFNGKVWDASLSHNAGEYDKWLRVCRDKEAPGYFWDTRFSAGGKINTDNDTQTQYNKLRESLIKRVFTLENLAQIMRENLEAAQKRAAYIEQYDTLAKALRRADWEQPRRNQHRFVHTSENATYRMFVTFAPSTTSHRWYNDDDKEPNVDAPGTYMTGNIRIERRDSPLNHLICDFSRNSDGRVHMHSIIPSPGCVSDLKPLEFLNIMSELHWQFKYIADIIQSVPQP